MSDPIKTAVAHLQATAKFHSDPNTAATVNGWADAIEALQSEAAALRAEVARLRGAVDRAYADAAAEVEAMADFSCGCDPIYCRCYLDRETYRMAADRIRELATEVAARAAIRGEGE